MLEILTVTDGTTDWQELQDKVGDNFYAAYDDPAVRRQIEEENWVAPAAYPVLAAEMAQWVRGQAGQAGDDMVKSWRAPVCLIEAMQMNDVARLKRLDSRVVVGQTVGTGHYVQLMAPGQVNGMIESISRMM
jgi:hypothetical protein